MRERTTMMRPTSRRAGRRWESAKYLQERGYKTYPKFRDEAKRRTRRDSKEETRVAVAGYYSDNYDDLVEQQLAEEAWSNEVLYWYQHGLEDLRCAIEEEEYQGVETSYLYYDEEDVPELDWWER